MINKYDFPLSYFQVRSHHYLLRPSKQRRVTYLVVAVTIGHGVLPRVPGCVPWLPLSEVVPRRPARRQLVEVVGAGVAVRQHLLHINHCMTTMAMMARNFTYAFSRSTRLALTFFRMSDAEILG